MNKDFLFEIIRSFLGVPTPVAAGSVVRYKVSGVPVVLPFLPLLPFLAQVNFPFGSFSNARSRCLILDSNSSLFLPVTSSPFVIYLFLATPHPSFGSFYCFSTNMPQKFLLFHRFQPEITCFPLARLIDFLKKSKKPVFEKTLSIFLGTNFPNYEL